MTHSPTYFAAVEALKSATSECPVSLERICHITGLTPRAAKAYVADLCFEPHCLPIAVRRGKPSGYWWARTAADLEAGARPLVHQAVEMLRRAEALLGQARLREMLGQERLFGEAERG